MSASLNLDLPERERIKISAELLKDTPWHSEGQNAERRREDEHRAITPRERQPFMVVIFGMLDYGVLWIGSTGPQDESLSSRAFRLHTAKRELEWWAKQIRKGMTALPFTRNPKASDLQVRQQWDLDELTAAIHRSYQ